MTRLSVGDARAPPGILPSAADSAFDHADPLQRHNDPPKSDSAPIQPYGGALIHCGSRSISYTPLIKSVPAPTHIAPSADAHSILQNHTAARPVAIALHAPTETLDPSTEPPKLGQIPGSPSTVPATHARSSGSLASDPAHIDHDTALRDHEIATSDHAAAERDHATAQSDAARSRHDLRNLEEDVARAKQAVDAHRVVEEIQRRMGVRPWHFALGIAAISATLVLAALGQFIPAAVVAIASVPAFLWLHLRWQALRGFRLHYELGASYDRAYADVLVACQRLENAGAEWCVQHGSRDAATSDASHDDPATCLKRARYRKRVSRACPPWIRCNLTPPMIPSQGRKLYLFPDHALLYEKGRVRAVVYTDMRFTTLETRAPSPATPASPPFGPPRPDTAAHGPVVRTNADALRDATRALADADLREPDGFRSQTIDRGATSHLGSGVQRYLTRKWSSPIQRDGAMQSMQSSTIESKSVIHAPPTGVSLNALHVSRLNWTGPTGMDAVHLISPANDAIALTNAVTRLGSVYAAGLRRTYDSR